MENMKPYSGVPKNFSEGARLIGAGLNGDCFVKECPKLFHSHLRNHERGRGLLA